MLLLSLILPAVRLEFFFNNVTGEERKKDKREKAEMTKFSL